MEKIPDPAGPDELNFNLTLLADSPSGLRHGRLALDALRQPVGSHFDLLAKAVGPFHRDRDLQRLPCRQDKRLGGGPQGKVGPCLLDRDAIQVARPAMPKGVAQDQLARAVSAELVDQLRIGLLAGIIGFGQRLAGGVRQFQNRIQRIPQTPRLDAKSEPLALPRGETERVHVAGPVHASADDRPVSALPAVRRRRSARRRSPRDTVLRADAASRPTADETRPAAPHRRGRWSRSWRPPPADSNRPPAIPWGLPSGRPGAT